jgi:3-methyladenine DNA glycosylase AlkD
VASRTAKTPDLEGPQTIDTDALVALVRAGLEPHRNVDNAKAMAAYLKTDDPFYGVKKPDRAPTKKAMLAQFAPRTLADYQAAVRALWYEPERENKYMAQAYADRFKAFHVPEAMGLFEELIRHGQWWDLIDLVATNLVGGAFLNGRRRLTPLMRKWNNDDDMWIRRTSILSQNRHRADTDTELLFKLCLARAHEKEFFIRKAIGWALRDCSRWFPDEVAGFIHEHHDELSGLSVREGTKRLKREGLWD